MKQSPQHNDLRSRLSASKFSGDGFLGNDARPVDEIINADLRALENAGVTLEEVSDALNNAYADTRNALGAEIELAPGVVAVFHESMGRIPSPFRGDGVFPKGEAVVFEKKTGRQIIITALGINLIAQHGFFQGKGSRYRIEPVAAIEIFSLSSS